jgi:hypothetical protein
MRLPDQEMTSERNRKALLKRAKASLEEARRDFAVIESDPRATATYKKEARERIQALELEILARHSEGIVSLTTTFSRNLPVQGSGQTCAASDSSRDYERANLHQLSSRGRLASSGAPL